MMAMTCGGDGGPGREQAAIKASNSRRQYSDRCNSAEVDYSAALPSQRTQSQHPQKSCVVNYLVVLVMWCIFSTALAFDLFIYRASYCVGSVNT